MGYPSVLLTCAVVVTILTTTATSKHTRHIPGVVIRESSESGRIFDISQKYTPEMPSFGTAKGLRPFLNLTNDIRKNCSTYNSAFTLPTHAGTHVDAPSHVYTNYFDQGIDVDTLDLYSLNGPVVLVDVPRDSNITGPVVLVDVPRDSNITVKVLESLKIQRGVKRMLFRTLNTDRGLMLKTEFDSSYVGFTEDAAKWLVQNTDIKLVGLDYLSVAAMDFLIPTHLVLLEKKDIVLVEGLKLDNINAGQYTLHCLPLRLAGAEASPVRCILIN